MSFEAIDTSEMMNDLRKTFSSGKAKPVEYRIQQLEALKRMLEENMQELQQALYEDLHKSPEVAAAEGMRIIAEIDEVLENLNEWTAPQMIEGDPLLAPGSCAYISYEPYGVVLILGAWNFPIVLTLEPFVGAVAAGNCVVLKPSEIAPASAQFMADFIPKYMDPDFVRVFLGGASETSELLKERFDYIFYTGSTVVGKIIHAAAANHLTPTTLELGGKSPVYLDSSTDIEAAAEKIMRGKTTNAGQICVAPDYLLCSQDIQEKFIEASQKAIENLLGSNPKDSPNYERIVNDRHFTRVTDLLNGCNIALGGDADASEKYISPTIVTDVEPTDPIMQQEIFGPILPIINVENVDEAVQFINDREKPLALYIFSEDEDVISKIISNTSSGGVCVNNTIQQLITKGVPFGGVGHSGMGCYHGKFSFETFSHNKSVVKIQP